jgi:predicted N-acetyltransferase YhbS
VTELHHPVSIRPYRSTDLAAVSHICMRTGDAGKDAHAFYRDTDLLPDIFVRPYLAAHPGLSFVADDGGRAVGYIVGTHDTGTFVTWFRHNWLPPLTDRHPLPVRPAEGWHDTMTLSLYRPERMLWPELVDHPAHVHANLLPDYQRRGLGGRLMAAFLDALSDAGAPGVHAAHSKYNISARGYYKKMGFEPLTVADPDPVRYVGRRLSPGSSLR